MATEPTNPEIAGAAGAAGVIGAAYGLRWLFGLVRGGKTHSTLKDIVGGDTPDPKELTAEYIRQDKQKQEERAARLHKLGDTVHQQELRVGLVERAQESTVEELTDLRIQFARIGADVEYLKAGQARNEGSLSRIENLLRERPR